MSELHEQIENYVTGQLTEREKADFEVRLEEDPRLAEQVALYRETDNALANGKLLDFVVTLQEVKQEFQKEKETPHKISRKKNPAIWYGIAASIILLITVITFWQSTEKDPIAWYNEAFVPYEAQALRNTGSRYPEELKKALEAYRIKDYSEAIIMMKPWENDEKHASMVKFYQAQALMASGKVSDAIPMWKEQLKADETVYTQSIQWYLVLSYLHEGDIGQARGLSTEILTTPQHAYTALAKKFLEDFSE